MGGKSDSVMERVIEYCRRVDREFKLKRVILFGSRCRGDFYPQSDIDLLLISDEFPDDWFARQARLCFCIERVFEISAVMNAYFSLGIPGGDEDIVDNLIRDEILPDDMKERLGSLKGFGNVMVHRYGKINDNFDFNIISKHLDDFYEFISLINDVISRNDFAIGRATR